MSNVRQTRSSGSIKNVFLETGVNSDQNNSVSADSDDEYSLNDQNEEESAFEDDASKANDSKDKSGSSRSKKGSSKPKLQFTCSNILKEGHNQPIFGIQFNDFYGDDHPPIFATVGSNQVLIYECSRESADIKLLSAYLDADADESFFTCAWSVDESSCQPLLAAAGARGVIRIISPCTHDPVKNYIGHGQSINELRFSPKDSNLLLSVSKDHTLRLWNIKTDVCVAIFGGVEGHRDELLSGDINVHGTLLVSCGMDHSLKIWKLDSECIRNAIEESYKHKKNASGKPFKTYGQHFADFSTRDIHSNYVDCVRWFGRLLLSKSCDNRIVCWKPGRLNSLDPSFIKTGDGHVTSVLHKFEFSACEIWFMRFSLDKRKKLMALGNQVGKVFVWDLDMGDPREGRHIVLSHPKCTAPVRQIGINNNGQILIAVCDDATIWRWDRN